MYCRYSLHRWRSSSPLCVNALVLYSTLHSYARLLSPFETSLCIFIPLTNLYNWLTLQTYTHTHVKVHIWWLGFKPWTPSLKTNPLHLYHGPPSPFGTNFGMFIPAIYTTGKPFRHTHVEVNVWLGFKP